MSGSRRERAGRCKMDRNVAAAILGNSRSNGYAVEIEDDAARHDLAREIRKDDVEAAIGLDLTSPRGVAAEERRRIGAGDNAQIVYEMVLICTARAGANPKEAPGSRRISQGHF